MKHGNLSLFAISASLLLSGYNTDNAVTTRYIMIYMCSI